MNFSKIVLLALSLMVAVSPAVTIHVLATDAEANVFIFPEESTVKINATFQILVNVSAVSKLQGFDFMLTYNSTLLSCLSVEEGSFLSGFGPTFVAKREINESFNQNLGRVWFVAVIYGTSFADGNGTLALITFRALSLGETLLNLYSDLPHRPGMVKLTTCGSQAIPNKATDGSITVAAENSDDPADPPPMGVVNPSTITPKVDINDDGFVNIEDVVIVAIAFGAVERDANYSTKADLDLNGTVDIRDLTLVALSYLRMV